MISNERSTTTMHLTLLRILFCFLTLPTFLASASTPIKHGLRDDNGRHVIARGFVIVTRGEGEDLQYDADDYTRMVRMGANYQVIRLAIGNLSDFPGCQLNPTYLEQLDELIKLANEAGIKTVLKMTVYGADEFTWEKFWLNENKEFDRYLAAWKVLWSRYQNEPAVLGYDLINEPRKLEMEISYDDLTNQYLLPYHRRLIDEKNKYSPEKVSICQAIFMNKGEGINHCQYAEIKEPINRDNVYFSPHIYLKEADTVQPVIDRLEKEADLWQAPMFIGEWGYPTYATADFSVEEQQEYAKLYQETAAVFDQTGVGTIKAWFSGNPVMQNFLPKGRSTWAIFSDKKVAGTVERKYITDVIARPYPQTIAGDIHSFVFDYATRELMVELTTDNAKGSSTLFVAADRHYPDGFTLVVGDVLRVAHDPLHPAKLIVMQSPDGFDPTDIVWDATTQRLHVSRWPQDSDSLTLQILPGMQSKEVQHAEFEEDSK